MSVAIKKDTSSPPTYDSLENGSGSDVENTVGDSTIIQMEVERQTSSQSTRLVFNKKKGFTLLTCVIYIGLLVFIAISMANREKNYGTTCVYNSPSGIFGWKSASTGILGWMIWTLIHVSWTFVVTLFLIWSDDKKTDLIVGSVSLLVFAAMIEISLIGNLMGMFEKGNGMCFRESTGFAIWLLVSLFPFIICGFVAIVALLVGLGKLFVKYVIPFDRV